jgi:hypothetical protein
MNLTIETQLSDNPMEWDIQGLEGLILEKSREAARLLYQEALLVFEKKHLKWRRPEWCLKDRWKKKISTLFGDVVIERYRVWDSKEKKSRYPLDEALGIKKWQRETKDFRKEVITQVVQRSYRQSSQEIEKQTGVKRSKMSTWHMIQKESLRQKSKKEPPLRWKNLALPKAPELNEEDLCPALGIDLDATYCRSWKTKKWVKDHAVRVAVLYRHKEKIGKNRWKLKDKQIVTSGPGERLRDFLEKVTHHAVTHYGLHENTQVVVHGDGDPWIRRYAEQYIPRALYRLDPWHVFKKMREATGLRKLPKTWIEAVYGHPKQLIGELKSFQMQFPEETQDYEKMGDLIGYITNNQSGLKPSGVSLKTKNKHPRLFLRGSGTIERNIDWTVCQRFKLSRMSWSQKGLENLLFLREDYLNGYKQPKYKPVPAFQKSFKAYL